ncbi:hypothetical protein ACE7GA_02110 [Roseomonas sp. CCTCC AB2023176]|uniref:hypothetical protein n=1 Tax=Roseomonas sp. CCTCC AB2023176 TaxID=3342640 RepID=UPI0035DA9954
MADTRRAAHFSDDMEWNAVWDDYDARRGSLRVVAGQGNEAPTPPCDVPAPDSLPFTAGRPFPRRSRRIARRATAQAGPAPVRPRRVVGRAVLGAMLSAALLLGLWTALPWLLAMRVTAAIRSPDPGALARQVEPAAAMDGLRQALLAEVPPGLEGAAGRWVADLAGRMAAAAEARGAATEWVRLRAAARERDGLPRLEVLRDLRAIGPAQFRLDYGPEHGPGGLRFDLAWQGTGFRVVGVRSLDTPPRELPPPQRPRTVLAMR